MNPGYHIDYKQLRWINPKTTRQAVLDYLESTGENISQTAQVFGINRCVVYDILKKQATGDLTDRSRTPKRQPNKTPAHLHAPQFRGSDIVPESGPLSYSPTLCTTFGLCYCCNKGPSKLSVFILFRKGQLPFIQKSDIA